MDEQRGGVGAQGFVEIVPVVFENGECDKEMYLEGSWRGEVVMEEVSMVGT